MSPYAAHEAPIDRAPNVHGEAATQTGVSFNTLSRIERGVGSPTVSNALAVLRWLDPQTAADMSGDTRGVGG